MRVCIHTCLHAHRKHHHSTPQAVYCESICNPGGSIIDLERAAAIAHSHGIPLIVDNTVPSPYLCRPIEHGADIVVHSATKYLNGHSDVCAGTVAGDRGRIEAAGQLLNRLGGFLDPHAAFLLERGLIDQIVPRSEMRDRIIYFLHVFFLKQAPEIEENGTAVAK